MRPREWPGMKNLIRERAPDAPHLEKGQGLSDVK